MNGVGGFGFALIVVLNYIRQRQKRSPNGRRKMRLRAKVRKIQKNNSTGFNGVQRSYDRSSGWGIVYERIRGFVQKDRKKYIKNFYVHKYINERAAILAAAMWVINKKIELERSE